LILIKLRHGLECGVLNGKVAAGSTVAIVGAGPIGLAGLLTAQFYSLAEIIMNDLDDQRLQEGESEGPLRRRVTVAAWDRTRAAHVRPQTKPFP
jgi:alcohol dehydrogenase